jgi:hypothetical protein
VKCGNRRPAGDERQPAALEPARTPDAGADHAHPEAQIPVQPAGPAAALVTVPCGRSNPSSPSELKSASTLRANYQIAARQASRILCGCAIRNRPVTGSTASRPHPRARAD